MKKLVVIFSFLGLVLFVASSLQAGSIATYSEPVGMVELVRSTGEAFVYNASGRISKFDSYGSVIWSNQYYSELIADPSQSKQLPVSLVRGTADGGCMVYGVTIESSPEYSSRPYGLLMKVDSEGSVSWLTRFQHNEVLTQQQFGPTFLTEDMIETNDGGYLISGYIIKVNTAPKGYLLKFNGAGDIDINFNWHYNGSHTDKVAQTIDGGYVFTGGIRNEYLGPNDVIKVNSQGLVQWRKSLSPLAPPRGDGDIYGLDDGGIVFISRAVDNHLTIVKMDQENGNIQWQKTFDTYYQKGGNFILGDSGGFKVAYQGEVAGRVTLLDMNAEGLFISGTTLNTTASLTASINKFQIAYADNKTLISSLKVDGSTNPSIINIDDNEIGSDCMWVSSRGIILEDATLTATDIIDPDLIRSAGGFSITRFEELVPPMTDEAVQTTIECATTCSVYRDKTSCNATQDCAWSGSPSKGSCQDDLPPTAVCSDYNGDENSCLANGCKWNNKKQTCS